MLYRGAYVEVYRLKRPVMCMLQLCQLFCACRTVVHSYTSKQVEAIAFGPVAKVSFG